MLFTGEDMAKGFAQGFYNSSAWKDCREAYKKKMHYLCERCGEPGDIVHHKKRVTPETIEDPEVLLSFENLELLCRRCHADEHAEDYMAKNNLIDDKRYIVDEFGHVTGKE